METRKRIYYIFILLATALTACTGISAQSFTLTGRVVDEENNPIELATVACVEQGKVSITNLRGNFTITLKSTDSVVVRFSMIGYSTRKRVFKKPSGKLNIEMRLPSMSALGEVVVTEKRRQTTATQQLDVKDMKDTPSATGNAVEDMIQQQAGVSTHNELSSQYNVRGGSFDENSVYINNVEIYRPLLIRSGQQEGLSIINSNMVESIGFSTGGFESKYGDKMSSALDIKYKKPKAFEANIATSMLGASAYLGYGNKKLSMTHGIRYKTNRYLLGSLDTKGEYRPNFLDYQTYISYIPNKRWNIDFIGNISENHYNFKPTDRETSFGTMENVKTFKVYFDGKEKDIFRTLFGTVGLTYNISDSTKVALIASAFHTKEQETYDIQGQYWLNDTQEDANIGVGTYMEHARNYLSANMKSIKLIASHQTKHHFIEGALTYKLENVDENSREYEMRDSSGYSIPHNPNRLDLIYSLTSNNKIKSNRLEGYIQDTYRFSTGLDKQTYYTLNYGMRFSRWSYNKELIVSPRASLAIIPAFNQDITFRFATGLYYQAPFFKELRDTTTINGKTQVILNRNIKSQRSIHFVAAFDYRFKMKERPYKFTAEAYYKLMHNLIPYNVNNVKITYYGQNISNGYATGIDFKLYGEFVPGTDSWVTFSLMSTKQKLGNIWIPMPTDQRYAVNLHFTDYFPGTDRWKMTLRLAFADGLPFGPPHRGLEYQNFRAPAYKRADIGMSYRALNNDDRKKKTAFKNIWLGIDCLNLFGISNINSYYWVTDVTNQQYAVPNYLTGRQINGSVIMEF
ncbi:TonB-dependent receptor [Xylanibacter muris]|uniref:TonB-dependent receptor plug domain-containing protein n=1 Tax=Xylanibacter muris TaxID=2736290 RepID=A0ABX2AM14_9BACT|nr:carboxypeptidase-like regulatory domain-containing protein [Xylanibacter muris]NPD92239.1 TonB-dependent receptor plug domain-containing protein [Xylanibacter muris]